MGTWGAYELSRDLSVSLRDREILIDRTCARCGCEYEWGVHIAFFASRVGFSDAQVTSLTHGSPDDACWDDAGERLMIYATDELHHTNTISDELYAQLREEYSEQQVLDLALLAGWYHAISYAARVSAVELEPWAPSFASVAG